MHPFASRISSSTRLATSALIAAASIALLTPSIAAANQTKNTVTEKVAASARTCVTSGACSVTATGRAFGHATQSMDRLGWEIGRYQSMKKHGPAADPGKYPGLRR